MSDNPAAVIGVFHGLRTMADGTPRITIDLQCDLVTAANMGLVVGASLAIATLSKQAAHAAVDTPPAAPKPPGGALAKLAGQWCREPAFQSLCLAANAEEAKHIVYHTCGIDSLTWLDHNATAAALFDEYFRQPYKAIRPQENDA